MASTLSLGNCFAFVLDFDGIITTLEIDWKSLQNQISATLNLKIDSFADFFEKNYGTEEFAKVSEIVKEKESQAARLAKPYSDVTVALRFLQENNSWAYVASMQSVEVLNYFLRKFDLVPFFKVVFGRENGGCKRSQLQQIRKLEYDGQNGREKRKTGRKSANLVLIDDLQRNVIIGTELGYDSILYRRGENSSSLVDVVKSVIVQRKSSSR